LKIIEHVWTLVWWYNIRLSNNFVILRRSKTTVSSSFRN